jgi:transcriptional regulator with XRE-family HTH domain
MSKIYVRFGKQLRRLRRSKDLTQEQLADNVGVSTEFISNIERGRNAPSFETLERLAGALNVPISVLFEFGEDSL